MYDKIKNVLSEITGQMSAMELCIGREYMEQTQASRQGREVVKEWGYLKCFIWENRWYILITSIFIVLIYGQWLFELSPHIDTEEFINTPYTVYGLQSGRPEKFLTSFIFSLRWYNPFMSSVFGFVLLCAAGVLFQYLLFRAGNVRCSVSGVFVLITFCSPIMVEQFYFFSQIFEMAWAYLLCAAAVGFSFYGVLQRSWAARFASVVSMIWIFGTYQIFTVLYVATVIVCFVLLYEKWADNGANVYFKKLAGIIGQLIFWFFLAYMIYSLINSIWFPGDGDYLSDMSAWGRDTFTECVRKIKTHIIDGFTGNGIYYSAFYGVFAGAAVLGAVLKVWKNRIKTGWLYVMAVIMLQLCPFLLTIYLGKAPVIRSQLAYNLVLAYDTVICVSTLKKYVKIKRVFQVLAIICLWMQLIPTMRLIYTDGIRAVEDNRLLCEVSSRIHEVSGAQKPVAFVGTYSNKLNHACLRGEMIGVSIFNIDSGASPHYFYSTSRICGNTKVLGVTMKNASEEQVLQARREALDMPVWPLEGAVKDAGDFIIVKLSDDRWAREILTPYAEETTAIDVTGDSGSLSFEVEKVRKKEGQLVIRGWLLENGVTSALKNPNVYLKENSTGKFYKLASAKQRRTDIAQAFGDEDMYSWCGFISLAPLSELSGALGDYSLILGYEDCLSEEELYIDPGIRLE